MAVKRDLQLEWLRRVLTHSWIDQQLATPNVDM
jgi:hypothetical protein